MVEPPAFPRFWIDDRNPRIIDPDDDGIVSNVRGKPIHDHGHSKLEPRAQIIDGSVSPPCPFEPVRTGGTKEILWRRPGRDGRPGAFPNFFLPRLRSVVSEHHPKAGRTAIRGGLLVSRDAKVAHTA